MIMIVIIVINNNNNNNNNNKDFAIKITHKRKIKTKTVLDGVGALNIIKNLGTRSIHWKDSRLSINTLGIQTITS